MSQALRADAVQRFLTDHVGSAERLEVLLFLQLHASRWWSAERLAAEIGLRVDAALSHLERLSSSNLLDVRIADSILFCYRPAREELAKLVEAIAQAHLHDPGAVAAALEGRPDSARLFAEAFNLRKSRKRDG